MSTESNRGPWTHRWLVLIFMIILGVLIYWLLGFVVNDLGSLPGPDYAAIEADMLDATLTDTAEQFSKQIANANREIEDLQERQAILRNSTENSQTTMNQLLEFQRLNLQKDVTPTEEERSALAESERLFLENQRRYQTLNEQISQFNEQLRDLKKQQLENQEALAAARIPVTEEFNQQQERHKLWMATLKLTFLTPLLIVALILYIKLRAGTYWAIVYAFGAAVLIKVGFVVHEYFPARHFKYILILVTLLIALRIMIYLLRMVAFPKHDWLVKQYREAYEAFLCPVCSYPIRRGPLKFMSWTRRSIRRLPAVAANVDVTDEPYTCPACSTQLHEKCDSCGATRHSLLPACAHCGTVKQIAIT